MKQLSDGTWNFLVFSLIVLCLSGCANLPRDVQGSTEKIRWSKILVVGMSEPSEQLAGVAAREKQLVEKVAQRLGVRVQWQRGNTHTLLQELEEVRLPIVAATIPLDSPFAKSVGLSQPYLKKGPNERDYCLAIAPGENRLLLLVDQVIAQEQKAQASQK